MSKQDYQKLIELMERNSVKSIMIALSNIAEEKADDAVDELRYETAKEWSTLSVKLAAFSFPIKV